MLKKSKVEFRTFLRNSARQPQRRLANPYSSLYIKHTHEDSVIICSVDPVRHTLDSAQPGGAHSTWHTPRTAHNPVAHFPSGAQWRTPRCAPTANGAQPGGAHHGWGTPRCADAPGGAHPGVRTPRAGHTPCVAQPPVTQPGQRTFRRGPRSRPSLTGGVSARTEPH